MNKWYEQAVFYHMYPLGMCGAPKLREHALQTHVIKDFISWLPHLYKLGITAIYIGPLFESTSHGYDTKDYYKIDSRLGSNEDFIEFVDACHQHDIKVVVDGVFNHTGKEFFAFQDILNNRENSIYRDWYKDVDFSQDSPSGEPFSFNAWRGIFELANLNLNNQIVRDYLLDVVRNWIHTFKIDGIRLDCADCLEFEFMKQLRHVCDEEKTDFWLMGELIHGDYSCWINDEMLHSSTNYELHKGLFSGHNEHNYFEIAHSIRREFDEQQGIYRGMTLYSFLDNHDVDRIASKLNNKENLIPAYLLLYTLPGIPSIYYGSEWGIEGRKEGGNDDLLRPCLNIEEMQTQDDSKLTQLLIELAKFKKLYSSLSCGRYKEVYLTNRQYAYLRYTEEETILIAVNNDESDATIYIPFNEPCASLKPLWQQGSVDIKDSVIEITLKNNSGSIIQLNRK